MSEVTGLPCGMKLSGIDVSFERAGRTLEVLSGFDVDFEPGKITALAGRSGSGKSTALNVVYGMQKPDAGQVTWGSSDISDLDEAKRQPIRKASFGFVSQRPVLFDDLDLVANVMVGGADRDEALAMLERVGLADLCSQLGGNISGGERQRVTVARAFAKSPLNAVLDEPTASLDAETAALVIEVISAAAKQGCAVAVASHDDMVIDAADTVLRL